MSNHRKVILFQKVTLNLSLLPIKGHYFFFFAASACVMPFLTIFARRLGISALAVGLIYTVLPFLTMATKPIFAAVADHLQRLKLLLLICLLLNTVSTVLFILIPPQQSSLMSSSSFLAVNGTLQCSTSELTISQDYNFSCIEMLANNSALCDGMCFRNCSDESYILKDNMQPFFSIGNHCKQNITLQILSLADDNTNTYHTVKTSIGNTSEFLCTHSVTQMNCLLTCNLETTTCFENNSTIENDINAYLSIQFWLFFLLSSLSRITNGICLALGDATCYEMLEGKVNSFGKQRMWGAIGWGSAALLTGWLNDIATGDSKDKNFLPGFCLFAVFMTIDIACIMQTHVKPLEPSKSILKDIIALFRKVYVIIFIFSVWIMGVLTGMQWSYSFWYFSDLGATQLLMGLTLTVQCFLGELPFFFFSGWIIKHIGHFLTVYIAIITFGVRYMLYSWIYNPWLILPIELAQGPTFGSFYAAMTSFAKENAPSGTEATMQGILGATFIGFGVAMGGLFAGVGFDSIGGRLTFRYTGIAAFLLGILLLGTLIGICKQPKLINKPINTNRTGNSEEEQVRQAEEASFLEFRPNNANQGGNCNTNEQHPLGSRH